MATDLGGNVRFASEPNLVRPTLDSPAVYDQKSIRRKITFSEHKFDVKTLPEDMQRVVGHLTEDFGEEYALTWAFMVRTAAELHRAWHMTLLTSRILQQIKDKFNVRTTWELGVIKLKFRVEDGRFELHRKVPCDYDSEFQGEELCFLRLLLDAVLLDAYCSLCFARSLRENCHCSCGWPH